MRRTDLWRGGRRQRPTGDVHHHVYLHESCRLRHQSRGISWPYVHSQQRKDLGHDHQDGAAEGHSDQVEDSIVSLQSKTVARTESPGPA